MIGSVQTGWRRFISFRFLRDKISEKGVIYILKIIIQSVWSLFVKLFIRIYSSLVFPVFYLANIRFTNFGFWAIGHMGHDPDYFVKEYFAERPVCERLINKHLDNLGLNIMQDWRIALKEYLTDYFPELISK